MPKNIILCSDGTGNQDVKGRGTNVFKLFEAIDLNGHRIEPSLSPQLAFYDDGVGTQGGSVLRAMAGATGYGLGRNVKKLYRELARVYDPGDRIFLFGFSRGAFTVRTLAGMIGTCGILEGGKFDSARALRKAVDDAYQLYRTKYDSFLTKAAKKVFGSRRKATVEKREAKIAFLGVWDTVDAVGMPFALSDLVNRLVYQFKFPATDLGRHVERACHALSIDDERAAFAPVLWKLSDDPTAHDTTRIEQVWFAGVHSNVGGGYPKQGMSLVALDWMLTQASQCGLRIQRLDWELFRGHATVDDRLYNSRAGFGLFYRWAPRDLEKYCKLANTSVKIHVSVLERIAHGTDDYAPGNIPPSASVVETPERSPAAQEFARTRAETCQKVFREACREHYLLDEVKSQVKVGNLSYWLYMTGWLSLIVAVLAALRALWLGGFQPWGIVAIALLATLAQSVAAAILARGVDGKLDQTFTGFWQKHQQDLRTALKANREEERAERAGKHVEVPSPPSLDLDTVTAVAAEAALPGVQPPTARPSP